MEYIFCASVYLSPRPGLASIRRRPATLVKTNPMELTRLLLRRCLEMVQNKPIEVNPLYIKSLEYLWASFWPKNECRCEGDPLRIRNGSGERGRVGRSSPSTNCSPVVEPSQVSRGYSPRIQCRKARGNTIIKDSGLWTKRQGKVTTKGATDTSDDIFLAKMNPPSY